MSANQVFITSLSCFAGSLVAIYWIGRAIDWYEVRQRRKQIQKP
jgi:hypothetical protein